MYLLHRRYMFRNRSTCIATYLTASLFPAFAHPLETLTSGGADLNGVLGRSDGAGSE